MDPEVEGVWVFPASAAHASVYPPRGFRIGVGDIPVWLEFAEQPPPILDDGRVGVHNATQDRGTLHQNPARLVPRHVNGSIVVNYQFTAEEACFDLLPTVAALEDKLEISII